MAIQALLVILAVLLVLLFLGVPISYAIAVSSLTAILSSIDLNVAVLTAAQRTFVGMSKFSLTAIPFFILAGNIMNQGGIIGGVFSATEGSAIAVVYALILAFCYRSINLKSLWKIIVDSAKMSGMVVFLVGVSNILGWVMAFLQIPDAVAAALLSLTSNKYIILLIMNVILLVSGTFMDVTPAILIFTPLFLPICQSFGMSTIQFGLILVYNLCIGNITPPVGNALFVGIKVGRTSLSKVMPYMLMYYVAIIGGLLLVTFIPAVSTALPQAMGLM